MSESESERGASEGGAGAAEEAGAAFAVKLMEIAAGASQSHDEDTLKLIDFAFGQC